MAGDKASTNGEFEATLVPGQWTEQEVKVCSLPKGGAIFFSDRLVHGSCTNSSGTDRYSLITTYHGTDPLTAADLEFDRHFTAAHDCWKP
jgi:ectoine hydroxylase-related dioxygenase (phytanoyl-CoA dioxygenase family)